MKNLALHMFMTLVTALAIGSASVAGDALARGSGGGGFTGGGFAAGHMSGFPAGRMDDDLNAGKSGYGDNALGFDCWRSQDVPTNPAWRLRQAGNGECY
jgi:hypothetical protein